MVERRPKESYKTEARSGGVGKTVNVAKVQRGECRWGTVVVMEEKVEQLSPGVALGAV